VGFKSFIASLPIVVGLQMVALFVVGAYRGGWRYFGLMDAVVLTRGVALGTLSSVAILLYLYDFANYSRAVFVIYAAILTLLLAGSRASFRLIGEFVLRRRETGRRMVIYGAGGGGSIAIRELVNGGLGDLRMLGFVDDDPHKTRTRMLGYPVLGGFDALESLITGGAVDVVVVSTTLIDFDRLGQLQALCEEHHVVLSRSRFELQHLVTGTQPSAARTV
jgi:FlaA1/EpsC-like NDP-sugar epimerase